MAQRKSDTCSPGQAQEQARQRVEAAALWEVMMRPV